MTMYKCTGDDIDTLEALKAWRDAGRPNMGKAFLALVKADEDRERAEEAADKESDGEARAGIEFHARRAG